MKLESLSLKTFSRKLSSKDSKIGGGSVSSYLVSLSAALLMLVVDFSSSLRYRSKMKKVLEEIEFTALEFITLDAVSFCKKDDFRSANEISWKLFVLIKRLYAFAQRIEENFNLRLLPDFILAERLLIISAENCLLNLEENMLFMKDRNRVSSLKKKVAQIRKFLSSFSLVDKSIRRRYGKSS